VWQENTHRHKVLTVALVAMIAHQASIQRRRRRTTMKRNALHVLRTRTARNQEEILHVKTVTTPKSPMQVQHFVPNVKQVNTCQQIVLVPVATLVKSAQHRGLPNVQIVKGDSTQMQQLKLLVVFLVVQASTAMKIFNILKDRVKVVLQENTHQRKVLTVATVAMIAHQASIQQRQQTTVMKRNAFHVLWTRTVSYKEEILPVTAVPMVQLHLRKV
jgi:hypothetical protein